MTISTFNEEATGRNVDDAWLDENAGGLTFPTPVNRIFGEAAYSLEHPKTSNRLATSFDKVVDISGVAFETAYLLQLKWHSPSRRSSLSTFLSEGAESFESQVSAINVWADLAFRYTFLGLMEWYARQYVSSAIVEKIIFRLQVLISAEIDEGEAPVSPRSVLAFLRFLAKENRLRYPDIVVTPGGLIQAEWRIDTERHCEIVFFADGRLEYVVFAPDLQAADSTGKYAGVSSPEKALGLMEHLKVTEWAYL